MVFYSPKSAPHPGLSLDLDGVDIVIHVVSVSDRKVALAVAEHSHLLVEAHGLVVAVDVQLDAERFAAFEAFSYIWREYGNRHSHENDPCSGGTDSARRPDLRNPEGLWRLARLVGVPRRQAGAGRIAGGCAGARDQGGAGG